VPTLQTLLDAGEATRGLHVTARGGHLIVGRVDEYGDDPRFRLTPLGAGAYGLSLYRRKRWEPLPFEGTLQELAYSMNHELATWADDWS
jgi:hypothetical protein